LKAAEKPAKEAAYNLNKNVAAIIIDGLMQYSFIDSAVINSSFGEALASGIQAPDEDSFTRSISNILFGIDKKYVLDLIGDDRDPLYGQLSITIDKHKAMGNLYERSLFILFSGLLRNLILGALLASVFYIVLTKPIVNAAEEIRGIKAAKRGKKKFVIPTELVNNEVGALLATFNEFVLGVKDADSFLTTVLDSSPTAMIINNNSNSVILYANPAAKTLLGRTNAELLGSNINDLYANMDDQTILLRVPEIDADINDFEPPKNHELFLKHKDGTKICIHLSVQSIEYEGQNVTISTFFDLTERKEMEQKLRHSQRMEAVGQLTGGVAHDFNNLLGIMLGNTEILSYKVENDKDVKNYIDSLKNAIERASSLTKRLLSFSRQLPLSPEVENIPKVVNDLKDMLQRTLGETVNLEIKAADKTAYALVDRHQLDNALINLTLNSRDSMPDGGKLTIETSGVTFKEAYSKQNQTIIPGDYVSILISDTGAGIPPEVIHKVFEPFFTTKAVGQGSGLGLSMVYGFAQQSKGLITAESKEGEGTTVTMYLPAGRQQAEEESNSQKGIVIENKTILLVEDNPEVCKTASSILNHIGYKVIEAQDGQAALDTLAMKPGKIDLVFSDVVMPNNMSGLDLAKKVMVDYPNIKILLTSGYPDKVADQKEIEKLGIELIAKPYKSEQLISAIKRVTD